MADVFTKVPDAPGTQPIMPVSDIEICVGFNAQNYKELTGEELPPVNPNLPWKSWVYSPARQMDPYDMVVLPVVKNGAVSNLIITALEAGKVNMDDQTAFPAEGQGGPQPPRPAQPPRPVPIRPLGPNEKLQTGFAGVFVVDTTSIAAPGGAGFTDADRAMLQRIAEKVGA